MIQKRKETRRVTDEPLYLNDNIDIRLRASRLLQSRVAPPPIVVHYFHVPSYVYLRVQNYTFSFNLQTFWNFFLCFERKKAKKFAFYVIIV